MVTGFVFLFAALQKVSVVVKAAFHVFGVLSMALALYQLLLVLRASSCAETTTALYYFLYASSVVGVVLGGKSAKTGRVLEQPLPPWLLPKVHENPPPHLLCTIQA